MDDTLQRDARPERIDKLLAAAGLGTRKQVRRLINSGRVFVNDRRVKQPGTRIVAEQSRVVVDDHPVQLGSVTMMMHKPTGLVTAHRDAVHPTVFDLLPPLLARRLFAAGRLDKESEGLLILTDDGQLCHRLISPRVGTEKEYAVCVDGSIPDTLQLHFSRGIQLKDGTLTRPAVLNVVKPDAPGRATLTIQEGKYHQVRRMFAWAGLHVTRLQRLRIGSLRLPPDLAPGAYRRLTSQEIDLLLTPATADQR